MSSVGKYQQKLAQIFFGATLLIFSACSDKESNESIIAQVGKTKLTATELNKYVPSGLTNEDSVKFVKAYIKKWIDSELISQLASSEINMDEIDRLTNEYRGELIMREYRRQMYNLHLDTITDDSIKSYYEIHKSEFKLGRPQVRGIYLKIPDNAGNINVIRKLYTSDRTTDVDRLEKEVLSTAIHYDYFQDRWIDWEQIESRIPYDFGESSIWLKMNKTLDVSLGGFTYLLNISEVLPTNSEMPYDVAKPYIVNRLQNANKQNFDANLMRDLYDHALSSGELKLNISLE